VRLIFNADDFGLHARVNEAVEHAHTQGVLTAASLMVGSPGMAEAVTIARRQPGLAVGLHLVLTDGVPVLPPGRIPALTQKNGRFRDDMASLGLTLAISPAARAELTAEIDAQIARFTETGLPCDHINAHKHFHLHPVIGALAVRAARAAGISTMRVPNEIGGPAIQNLWCRVMRATGLPAPDRVVGLRWSGAFTAERLLEALPRTPPGVTEFYFHPATSDDVPGGAPGYRYTDELAALTDPRVIAAVQGIPRGGYAAMLGLRDDRDGTVQA
jgi:hopanoid biosynthesis associated protein HpnK